MSDQVKPIVGMGATMCLYTDRVPYTVIKVVSDRKIIVQADNAKRLDNNGMSESQDYEYTSNPEGEVKVLTFRKDKCWRVMGDTQYFHIGSRIKYHDYGF